MTHSNYSSRVPGLTDAIPSKPNKFLQKRGADVINSQANGSTTKRH